MEKTAAGRQARPRHQRARLLLRQPVLRHHEPGGTGDCRFQLHPGLHPHPLSVHSRGPYQNHPQCHFPGPAPTGLLPFREWLTGWHMSYPELKGKFTLCLPGRITRLKGQLDLIPIVRQLLERGIPAHAVIVGETKKGKEEYKNEVLREIERAGVSHAFTWTGHRQDLRDIISTCSVTLSLTKARRPSANQPLRRSPWADPLPGTPTAESRNNWTPSCRKETSPWGTPHPWLPCFPAGTPSPLPCPVTYPPLTRWRI